MTNIFDKLMNYFTTPKKDTVPAVDNYDPQKQHLYAQRPYGFSVNSDVSESEGFMKHKEFKPHYSKNIDSENIYTKDD